MRWLDVITDLTDMNLSKLWETVKDREACWAAVHGNAKSQTRLRDKTTDAFSTLITKAFIQVLIISHWNYCNGS